MEMPGIEPGAFHMQSERSTTELHPLFVLNEMVLLVCIVCHTQFISVVSFTK